MAGNLALSLYHKIEEVKKSSAHYQGLTELLGGRQFGIFTIITVIIFIDMKKEEKVLDAGQAKWLSEVVGIGQKDASKTDLPDNCILNKVVTGCGGTTVALKSSKPYVIAVPRKSLIDNKLKWAKEHKVFMCGLHSGISERVVKSAVNKGCTKFMVTYDSLGKLSQYIDYTKYKILIDESHNLLKLVGSDRKALSMVKLFYKTFKSFVFMSATPTKVEYELEEFKNIPRVTIKWNNIQPVDFTRSLVSRSLYKHVALRVYENIDKMHTVAGKEYNVNSHVFMNSITAIIKVVKYLEALQPGIKSSINVMTGLNNRNELMVMKNAGMALSTVGEVNRINFYTETGFEGADIYDLCGKTYIVTDGNNDYTKYDIESTIPQIIHRVRNSVFRDTPELIYSSSKYFNHTTFRVFKEQSEKELAQAELLSKVYNMDIDAAMGTSNTKGNYRENKYLVLDKIARKVSVNKDMLKRELSVYTTLNDAYYVRSTKVDYTDEQGKAKSKYVKTVKTTVTNKSINGSVYKITDRDIVSDMSALENVKVGGRASFSALCKAYCEASIISDERDEIALLYPDVVNAFNILGAKKLKALKYRKGAINSAIILKQTELSLDKRVQKLLNLKVGEFIPTTILLDKANKIYKQVGLDKPATIGGLANLYAMTECRKGYHMPVEGGGVEYKRVMGRVIVRERVLSVHENNILRKASTR